MIISRSQKFVNLIKNGVYIFQRTKLSKKYLQISTFHSSALCRAMFNIQDEDDFQEKVIKSDTPVVVDFYAKWCGPCKLLTPRLDTIISEKGEKVHLAKINIDEVVDLAIQYGVSAVPSVIAVKNGKVVDKFVGLQEEARIEAFVNKLISE